MIINIKKENTYKYCVIYIKIRTLELTVSKFLLTYINSYLTTYFAAFIIIFLFNNNFFQILHNNFFQILHYNYSFKLETNKFVYNFIVLLIT